MTIQEALEIRSWFVYAMNVETNAVETFMFDAYWKALDAQKALYGTGRYSSVSVPSSK